MLVLDAKVGDTVYIGEGITLTVLRTSGAGKFKLGIEAPKNVRILRDKVKAKMEEAANDKPK